MNSDGTSVRYLNGLGIDNKIRQTVNGQAEYFLNDHLGSTTALTNPSGAVVSSAVYDSFGNATGNLNTRYQYTGREYDADTGLQYSRARWYDPKIGRFISEDPIGLNGGINQFGYVGGNPVNATDPSGLYEIDVHYYMTLYLGIQTRCFTYTQAMLIANGNQITDEADAFSPGLGKRHQNSTYHALHNGAARGVGSADLLQMAIGGGSGNNSNYLNYGRYLHYLQDTYSHDGYNSDYYGHASAGHFYDKTSTDVNRAVSMAKATFSSMKEFARSQGCDCSTEWNSTIEGTIGDFARLPGAEHAEDNSIDSVGDYLDFGVVNPQSYLENKRLILGVPLR